MHLVYGNRQQLNMYVNRSWKLQEIELTVKNLTLKLFQTVMFLSWAGKCYNYGPKPMILGLPVYS
jgi:hypothetical protein